MNVVPMLSYLYLALLAVVAAVLLWLFSLLILAQFCKAGRSSIPDAKQSVKQRTTDPLAILLGSQNADDRSLKKLEVSETTAKEDQKKGGEKTAVGLITAHPDDESMFFSPTILNLLQTNQYEIHILCFSTGNADGLGEEREKELVRACSFLGIPEANLEIIDDPMIQDGFNSVGWTPAAMVPYLRSFTGSRDIVALITFDETGVSGHPNHRATCLATRAFCEQQLKANSKVLSLWELKSELLPNKFLGPIFAAWHLFTLKVGSLLGVKPQERSFVLPSFKTCLSAMQLHKTQWVWFRWAFVYFSTYPYINVLVNSAHNQTISTIEAISTKKSD